MYIPKYFEGENKKDILDLVKNFSFATIISKDFLNEVVVSHLPLICESQGDEIVQIRGHFSQRNPHVQYLKKNPDAIIIFNGPHCYISPRWYRSGRDVPTWNYKVVHIKGKIQFESDYNSLVSLLRETTLMFEGKEKNSWSFDLPDDLNDEASLMSAIVEFGFYPQSVSAKFKLSQNRSVEDQAGISEGLATRSDDMSRFIKANMDKNLKAKF